MCDNNGTWIHHFTLESKITCYDSYYLKYNRFLRHRYCYLENIRGKKRHYSEKNLFIKHHLLTVVQKLHFPIHVYLTMGETWIYHFILDSKSSPHQCIANNEQTLSSRSRHYIESTIFITIDQNQQGVNDSKRSLHMDLSLHSEL